MAEDHEFGRSAASPSIASPSLATGSATPSTVLAPCIVAFQLGAILEQLNREYADQPEWTAWVRATLTSASHWISRAHLTPQGVATTPDDTREASKRDSARATEPKEQS